jgi:LuxR family maltose regulon positive regulatory protein
VVHAQLATIWAHTVRGELAQARQRFDSVSARTAEPGDRELRPGLAAAVALTGARLAAVGGDARIGRDLTQLCRYAAVSGFFADQLRSIRAEAELNTGQPAGALELLDEAVDPGLEAQLLRSRAWLALGELPSAVAALRNRSTRQPSLLGQVQLELLEARLAQGPGDRDRRRALVDRALRTAEREQLRTPLRWVAGWLRTVVGADPVLLRRHGAFVATIRRGQPGSGPESAGPTAAPAPIAPPTTPLTRRELDILQRLAGMSTNEEIAAELFLSTNTIKTHLKSLYRKLDVVRRADAVRHGRALGLC